MEFLVIVAALALHKLIPNLRFLHQDNWYYLWLQRMGNEPLPLSKYIASLALPVLAVLAITVLINRHFGAVTLFLFSLLGLLYSLGRGDLPAQLQTLEQDVERDDQQAAYHDTAAFNNAEQGCAESGEEFHREVLQSVSYRFFEHAFPVIFWFALLGVPGALLYRLTEIHVSRQSLSNKNVSCDIENTPFQSPAERWLWLMEWVPVRLLGFTFALVGNFACCMHYWRECVVCPVRTTQQILVHYVVGALSADVESATIEVAELEAVKKLFYRALTLWVCVIALLVVL